jgi:hypothetical protein
MQIDVLNFFLPHVEVTENNNYIKCDAITGVQAPGTRCPMRTFRFHNF